jgi:hypothetical protein
MSRRCEGLDLSQPYGPSRPVTGIAFITRSEQGKTTYECYNKSSGTIQGEELAEVLAFQEGPCYIVPVTIEVP